MDRHTAEPAVRELPGERARRWVAFHAARAPPSTYVYDFVWDYTAEAEGPFCTDLDGNVLMDFTSHVAAAPLGYNNPKLLERASEFDLVDPLKIAGNDFYAAGGVDPADPALPGPTQLLDRLVELGSGYGLDRAFLSNSGAEAVENAIKICYADRGPRAFCFDGAFHGRTLGALSLNRSKRVHRAGYPEVPGVEAVPFCTCEDDCRCGWRTDGPGGNVIADRLHPERGVVDPESVAYIIVEPVQGEGGYRFPSERFLADLAAIRERHGIPIVADEIQSGLGRTGEWWAVDHGPLEPDVITAAKGLRVGATVARGDRFPAEKGRISSTWGAGDIVDSFYGVLTLDAIEEHDLLANATVRGRHLKERLAAIDADCVEDVRGRGLMVAVEFDTREHREAAIAAALQRGLLTLGCGYKTLRLLPPLDVTEREVDLGADLLGDAIADVAG